MHNPFDQLTVIGAAIGISINGFTSPEKSYCILNFKGLPNPSFRNPWVHQQRSWKSTGSQEPKDPVLTQPLKYTIARILNGSSEQGPY